jgi:hypothetical protein
LRGVSGDLEQRLGRFVHADIGRLGDSTTATSKVYGLMYSSSAARIGIGFRKAAEECFGIDFRLNAWRQSSGARTSRNGLCRNREGCL